MSPEAGAPQRPSSLDRVARECWDRVVPQLQEIGVLTRVDRESLEGFCSSYSAAVRYQRIADKNPIVDTPFGPKVNPAQKEARAAWMVVRAFCTEFGLTPAARSRVSAPGKSKEDPAEAFLFGGPPKLAVVK